MPLLNLQKGERSDFGNLFPCLSQGDGLCPEKDHKQLEEFFGIDWNHTECGLLVANECSEHIFNLESVEVEPSDKQIEAF